MWKPKTDDHRRLMAETIAAVAAWKKAEEDMYAAFAAARDGGVKMTHLLEAVGDEPSSATVYRHIGRGDGAAS